MNIETHLIENGLVKFLVDIIGHRLNSDKNGRPNVIVAYPSDNSNDKGLKPDQPYMSVYTVNADTPYGWLLGVYVDEEDKTCYQIAFRVNVRVTAHGKGSHSIITELKQRLEFAGNRDALEQFTGARLSDTGELPNNYDYMNTDFEAESPLTISLVLNSVLVDPTGGIIEKVITDGSLYYSSDQPTPDIKLHIEAP